MINYLGTKDAELHVGLPDTSTVCNQTDIDVLFDTYLEEFMTILYFAAYHTKNESIIFHGSGSSTVTSPKYPQPYRSLEDNKYLKNLPYIGAYPEQWDKFKLFRSRKPSLRGEGHVSSRNIYDNVFKYFAKLKVLGSTATYEKDPSDNFIIDTLGEKLIQPERYTSPPGVFTPWTKTINTGIKNSAGNLFEYHTVPTTGISIGEIELENEVTIKRLDDSLVIIPLTEFAAEGAVVFALYCIREQLLRNDPSVNSYNAFPLFQNFFTSVGFTDIDFIIKDLIDPDRPFLESTGSNLNTPDSFVKLLKDSMTIPSRFDKSGYSGMSDIQIVIDILSNYEIFKQNYINNLANCIFRKFGWRGKPFDSKVVLKGNGTGTSGILAIGNAGINIGTYTFIVNSGNIVVEPSRFSFDFLNPGTKKVHWSTWGYNPNQGISDLDIKMSGQEYKMTSRYYNDGLFNNAKSELFYPKFIFIKKDDGTLLSRLTTIPIDFNPNFKWRKDKWWKIPKEDRFIAKFRPNSQTLTIEKNEYGTLEFEFGGSIDEVFGIFIAYSDDPLPVTTTNPPIITEIEFSFALDLSKTYRDDHFLLLQDVRDMIWQTPEDIQNIDALIGVMLLRFADPTKNPYNLNVLVNGNGIGLRPRRWVSGEKYLRNEQIIVQTETDKFNVFKLIEDELIAGATFSAEIGSWKLELPAYDSNSSTGYKMNDKVIFNSNPLNTTPPDPIYSELFEAKEDIDPNPGTFDKTKWRKIPIVSTDPEREHFPPNLTATRSDALRGHHEQLRYSFLSINTNSEELNFVANAWVSPIRSRLDRMYRNYAANLIADNRPIDLIQDINTLTFFDPSKNSDAGNPDENNNIPLFPNKEYNLIQNGTSSPILTHDGRTWGPDINYDYPHRGDYPENTSTAYTGYTPGASWFPIYNPLLSNLRAMTILEEGANRIKKRAEERQLQNNITSEQYLYIEEQMKKVRESSSFTTAVWNNGSRDEMMVDYEEFCRIKIQPTCPEPLPDGLTCSDFTNSSYPDWTHGFGYVNPDDPCTPCQ